jgi:hypothetical protein
VVCGTPGSAQVSGRQTSRRLQEEDEAVLKAVQRREGERRSFGCRKARNVLCGLSGVSAEGLTIYPSQAERRGERAVQAQASRPCR